MITGGVLEAGKESVRAVGEYWKSQQEYWKFRTAHELRKTAEAQERTARLQADTARDNASAARDNASAAHDTLKLKLLELQEKQATESKSVLGSVKATVGQFKPQKLQLRAHSNGQRPASTEGITVLKRPDC